MADEEKTADPDEKVAVRLTPPAALVRERDRLIVETAAIAIASPEGYAAAVGALQRIKAAEKRWAEMFLDTRRPLLEAQRRSTALEKTFLEPARAAIAQLETAIKAWRAEQQQREEALRRQAREAAEVAAREERARQVAALEAARKATPSRIEKKALKDQAAQLAAAPIVPQPTAAIATTVPKVGGLSERETWVAEVVDPDALVAACAVPVLLARAERDEAVARAVDDGLSPAIVEASAVVAWLRRQAVAPRDYVVPNQAALDAVATQCRADVPVPGVEGRRRTSLVVRTAGAADEAGR